MAQSKLIESQPNIVETPDGSPIDLLSKDHEQLAMLAGFLEELAQKENLIPQGTPHWVAYQKDTPAHDIFPARFTKKAVAVYESPLEGKAHGYIRVLITVQQNEFPDGESEAYDQLSIQVTNHGHFGSHRTFDNTYSTFATLKLTKSKSQPRMRDSFSFHGTIGLLKGFVCANSFPGEKPSIQFFPSKNIPEESVVLYENGQILRANLALARTYLLGLDLDSLARHVHPKSVYRILRFLANEGVVCDAPEDFWRIFSTDAVK